MKLEQRIYETSRLSVEEDRKYLGIKDLEYLTVSPLYSSCSIIPPSGGSFSSGSGSIKKKSGSGPLEFPKWEPSYTIPKVSSGPVLPKIDMSVIKNYLDSFNPPKVGSKPLNFPNLEIRPAKKTEYFNLLEDNNQTIGITHHPIGMGKLKIYDKEEDKEYGVPISDIIKKHLKDWNFDIK